MVLRCSPRHGSRTPRRAAVVLVHGVAELRALPACRGVPGRARLCRLRVRSSRHGRSDGSAPRSATLTSTWTTCASCRAGPRRARKHAAVPLWAQHGVDRRAVVRATLSGRVGRAGPHRDRAAPADPRPSPPLRPAGWIAKIIPGAAIIPAIVPSGLSRDSRVIEAYRTDPLVTTGGWLGWSFALASAVAEVERRLPEIKLPLLALHGGDDPITLPGGADVVRERAGSNDSPCACIPACDMRSIRSRNRRRCWATSQRGWTLIPVNDPF